MWQKVNITKNKNNQNVAKDKNRIEGKIKHISPKKTMNKLTRYY